MQSPAKLKVTGKARVLAMEVYRLTSRFPREERYGLTAQMRSAAISIGSNIAEGCGRSTDRELMMFLHYAMGSANELEFQTLIASDLAFIEAEPVSVLAAEVEEMKRMLSRLIVAIRARSNGSKVQS